MIDLIELADHLDKFGRGDLADKVDEVIRQGERIEFPPAVITGKPPISTITTTPVKKPQDVTMNEMIFKTHSNALIHIQYGLKQAYQDLVKGSPMSTQSPKEKMAYFNKGLDLYYKTVWQYLGSVIQEFNKLKSKKASSSSFIKEANQKLTSLVQEVEAQLSNVSNWSRLMQPKKEDIDDMMKRVDNLSILFAKSREFLKVPYTDWGNANDAEPLVNFADFLDEQGAHALADKVTEVAALIKCAYIPKIRKADVKEEPPTPPVQPPYEGSLSTRYCPDHHGVQAVRISERIFQCPIDGKTYNYETGYVNYQGQRVPGGSVAEQTPITSNTGGVPMRFYDNRQSILNRIN